MDKNTKLTFQVNLNKISIKSEVIRFEKYDLTETIKKKLKFEIVIRNSVGKVVAVGKEILEDNLEFEIEKFRKEQLDDFEYPVFLILKDCKEVFLVRDEIFGSFADPRKTFEQFFMNLKNNDFSLKLDSDLKIESLHEEIVEQKKVLEVLKEEHEKIINSNSYCENHKKELESELKDKESIIDIFVNQEKKRLQNVINIIKKKFDVKKALAETYNPNENFRGRSEPYYSILNGELALKKKVYDYYEKGRGDYPEWVFSHSIFFMLNEKTTKFEVKNEDLFNEVMVWV